MSASKVPAGPHFGFLRVTDLGGAGMIGGYLVVNAFGRPLEFHCTEPMRPNRAQQILFGATLQPYVYGEQIGRALCEHSQTPVDCVFAIQADVLCLRGFVNTPVACLADDVPTACHGFRLGPNQVYVEQRYAADQPKIEASYEQALPDWRLDEPFQRIQEALAELQKAA